MNKNTLIQGYNNHSLYNFIHVMDICARPLFGAQKTDELLTDRNLKKVVQKSSKKMAFEAVWSV